MVEHRATATDSGLRIKTELSERVEAPVAGVERRSSCATFNMWYGRNQALHDISMDIGERRVTAFIRSLGLRQVHVAGDA